MVHFLISMIPLIIWSVCFDQMYRIYNQIVAVLVSNSFPYVYLQTKSCQEQELSPWKRKEWWAQQDQAWRWGYLDTEKSCKNCWRVIWMNFMASVRSCLSEEMMSMSRVRILSRRARQYIFAYHHVMQLTKANSINNYSGSVISFVLWQSKAL